MATSGLRSCSAVGVPSLLAPSSNRSRLPVCAYATTSGRVTMSAEWMPGQPRPAHLDGSSPGDFGFDPLGLATVPENFERFKESEVYHCRWAMLAVVWFLILISAWHGLRRHGRTELNRMLVQPGVLVPEALGLGNWVQAQEWAAEPGGQATYLGNPVPWGTLPTILVIEFVAIAFAEHQRTMEKDPEKKKYPGGAFDPLGFSKDPVKFEEYKLKEIKNGRLAMLAFVGFCVQQSAYPGTGPLENLASHLSDPWHNNIGDIIIPRTIYP
uniref:Chlorophyll a-b binding protein, chloroplastic n=1 Tax=Oryza rufipogon TaxID=4529 RepID=A0A0E0PX40_ORYRU